MALPIQAPIAPQVNPGGGLPTIATSGPDMTVDLNAQRTIIDWSSFNVTNGESVTFFVERAGAVILNRVASGAMNIDGRVNTFARGSPGPTAGLFQGGNLWLYSPDGVIFGPNARVVTNDILATSSAVNPSQFLDASNVTFDFTGSGQGGPVIVRGGAQLSTVFGHLALIAPMVTTEAGSVMTGDTAEVFYGAADSYRIRFQNEGNDDFAFNIIDFIVPARADGTLAATALNLSGTTNAHNVSLFAISRAAVAGLLINAPGLITATASQQFGGGGGVTISTGENKRDFNVGFGTTTARTLGATAGSVSVGQVNADRFLTVLLHTDTTLGNLTATGLRGGANVYVSANNVTIGAGGISAGRNPSPVNPTLINNTLDTSGVVRVQTIDAAGLVNISAGTFAQRTGLRPDIQVGTVTAGGQVLLFGSRASATSVTAGGVAQMATAVGPLTVGSIRGASVLVNGAQDVNLGTATANGLVSVSSFTNLTAGTLTGDVVNVGTNGLAIVNSSTSTAKTGMQAGYLRVGTVTSGGDATLGGFQGLQIDNRVSAPNLLIQAFSGEILLGSSNPEFGITNQTFNRIFVPGKVDIYAGLVDVLFNFAPRPLGDITVGDLTIDPAKVSRINLFASNANSVDFLGNVRVTGPGVELRVGEAAANSIWTPDTITISGSLGSAQGDALTGFSQVQGFKSVAFYATKDIGLGSQRFFDLVEPLSGDQIDIAKGIPTGVEPQGSEVGKLFLVAGTLTLSAPDRIIQQNTGTMGIESGLLLTGEGVEATAPVLTIGKAGTVDLFGSIATGSGFAVGQQLSVSNRIARAQGETGAATIRINGCALGIGCQLSTPATQFRVEQFSPPAPRAAVDPPVLTPPPPVDEEDREVEAITAGTGNEEIWRRDR